MSATPATPDAGRDAKGRFSKGNPGGPGNPFARAVAELRAELLACASREDVRAVATALREKAKAGDVPAARLYLAYTVGKPADVVNPDRLDVEEWQLLKEEAPMLGELPKVVQFPEPGLPLTFARSVRPAFTEHYRGQMHELLTMPELPSPNRGNGKAAPSPNGGRGARPEDVAVGACGAARPSPPAGAAKADGPRFVSRHSK